MTNVVLVRIVHSTSFTVWLAMYVHNKGSIFPKPAFAQKYKLEFDYSLCYNIMHWKWRALNCILNWLEKLALCIMLFQVTTTIIRLLHLFNLSWKWNFWIKTKCVTTCVILFEKWLAGQTAFSTLAACFSIDFLHLFVLHDVINASCFLEEKICSLLYWRIFPRTSVFVCCWLSENAPGDWKLDKR